MRCMYINPISLYIIMIRQSPTIFKNIMIRQSPKNKAWLCMYKILEIHVTIYEKTNVVSVGDAVNGS